jgi:hypothetical protein
MGWFGLTIRRPSLADHDFSAVPVSVGVVTTLSGSAPRDVWW